MMIRLWPIDEAVNPIEEIAEHGRVRRSADPGYFLAAGRTSTPISGQQGCEPIRPPWGRSLGPSILSCDCNAWECSQSSPSNARNPANLPVAMSRGKASAIGHGISRARRLNAVPGRYRGMELSEPGRADHSWSVWGLGLLVRLALHYATDSLR